MIGDPLIVCVYGIDETRAFPSGWRWTVDILCPSGSIFGFRYESNVCAQANRGFGYGRLAAYGTDPSTATFT